MFPLAFFFFWFCVDITHDCVSNRGLRQREGSCSLQNRPSNLRCWVCVAGTVLWIQGVRGSKKGVREEMTLESKVEAGNEMPMGEMITLTFLSWVSFYAFVLH